MLSQALWMRARRLWPVLAAALVAVPGAAQDHAGAPPDPVGESPAANGPREIVVPGERVLAPRAITTQLRRLTIREKFTERPPRFFDPLCPVVAGLDPPLAESIAARIRANGAIARLPPAKPDCRPNAFIIVADAPATIFEQLLKKRPALIGTYEFRDRPLGTVRAELAAGQAAVSWSQMTQRPTNGVLLGNLDGNELRTNSIPRLRPTVMMQKDTAVVLFDRRRLVDVEVGQLADFATLHLLGGPRPGADLEGITVPTLMTLFRDGPKAAPNGLTEFDRAYLAALHALDGEALGKPLAAKVMALYEEECALEGGTCEVTGPAP